MFVANGAISSDEPAESFKYFLNLHCAGMQAAEMRYIRAVKTCTRLGHIKTGSM
jgi:hypothetical protein